MNRYKFMKHIRVSHWVCIEKFGLERYFIHPGDIMEMCQVHVGGARVLLKAKEYNGIAGLNLESLSCFRPVYEPENE